MTNASIRDQLKSLGFNETPLTTKPTEAGDPAEDRRPWAYRKPLADDDTNWRDTITQYQSKLRRAGFEEVKCFRMSVAEDRKKASWESHQFEQCQYIYANYEKGLILTFDTCISSKEIERHCSINGGTVYYQWIPTIGEPVGSFYPITSSGGIKTLPEHVSRWRSDPEWTPPKGEWWWQGDHPAITGLIATLEGLEVYGSFIKEWKAPEYMYRGMFLSWVDRINYQSDASGHRFDDKGLDALCAERYLSMPDKFRNQFKLPFPRPGAKG